MRIAVQLMLATVAIGSPVVHAQQTSSPSGSAVITSSPGKADAVATAEIRATVTAVDKATRKLTLKGPRGKSVDAVVSDEVRNFDQIKLGDEVVVQYREALSLELRKTKGKTDAVETGVMATAKPGERPAAIAGREVKLVAEVVAVDPKNNVISLKGPKGNVVDLKVRNPDHFKVVKKGDQVDATYTEAVAIDVRPAEKRKAK